MVNFPLFTTLNRMGALSGIRFRVTPLGIWYYSEGEGFRQRQRWAFESLWVAACLEIDADNLAVTEWRLAESARSAFDKKGGVSRYDLTIGMANFSRQCRRHVRALNVVRNSHVKQWMRASNGKQTCLTSGVCERCREATPRSRSLGSFEREIDSGGCRQSFIEADADRSGNR